MRLLKTQSFEKKQSFQLKKYHGLFSRSIEHDKRRGSIHWGPEVLLTIIVQDIVLFL